MALFCTMAKRGTDPELSPRRRSKRLATLVPLDTPPAVLSALEELPREMLETMIEMIRADRETWSLGLAQQTSRVFLTVVRTTLVRQLRGDARQLMAGVRAWDVQRPLDRATLGAAERIAELLRAHVVSDAWYVAHGAMDGARGAPLPTPTRLALLTEELVLEGDVPMGAEAMQLVQPTYPIASCSSWIRDLAARASAAPLDWVQCWYALNAPTSRYHLLQDFLWVRRFVAAWAETDAACCFAHLLVRALARRAGERAHLFPRGASWQTWGGSVFLYTGQPWLTLAMLVPLATRVARDTTVQALLRGIRLFELADQPVFSRDVGRPPPGNDTFHRLVAQPLALVWLYTGRHAPYFVTGEGGLASTIRDTFLGPELTLPSLAEKVVAAADDPLRVHAGPGDALTRLHLAPVERALWLRLADRASYRAWPAVQPLTPPSLTDSYSDT